MTLEVEAAALRGFLTAREENTWRQSFDSAAGEQSQSRLVPGTQGGERERAAKAATAQLSSV